MLTLPKLPLVEVHQHNGRPTIFVDGVPKAMPTYSPTGWRPDNFKKTTPWFCEIGMGIYFVSYSRPTDIVGQGKDFALRLNNKIYLFIHDLKGDGDENVVIGGGVSGIRSFSNFNSKVKSMRWMDNDENLEFMSNPEKGLFGFHPTGYPYGTNLVVRIAELEISQ